MNERLIIQLLEKTTARNTSEFAKSDDIQQAMQPTGLNQHRFRWGFAGNFSNWQSVAHEGCGMDMLASLQAETQQKQHKSIVLLPGSRVVTTTSHFNQQEAKHFLKLLPYQIEEEVLEPVDELFFVASKNRKPPTAAIAYTQAAWLHQALSWLRENGIQVDQCYPDYQCLKVASDELVLWFQSDCIWGHFANGTGFSTSKALFPMLIEQFIQSVDFDQKDGRGFSARIYVRDADEKEYAHDILQHCLQTDPVSLDNTSEAPQVNVVIEHPHFDFNQNNQINFCSGRFGAQLPIHDFWRKSQKIVALGIAATLLFFIAIGSDIYRFKQEQQRILMERDKLYRIAIPTGPSSDPIRRLKAKLSTRPGRSLEPSQSLYLLSKVAPIMQQMEVDLATLNYDHNEQVIRINVSANSFATLEQFRQSMINQGLTAELQSSNAARDGYQARFRIKLQG